MTSYTLRKAVLGDASEIDALLSQWFDWSPESGRLASVRKAIGDNGVLVAQKGAALIGFIHYVLHQDMIDGGLNAFISAFYVSPTHRRKGVGSLLLNEAITDSVSRGAVGIETSTTQVRAKRLYERNHFKQTIGDMGEIFLELDLAEYSKSKRSDVPRP